MKHLRAIKLLEFEANVFRANARGPLPNDADRDRFARAVLEIEESIAALRKDAGAAVEGDSGA
jgi:hypothetical protein